MGISLGEKQVKPRNRRDHLNDDAQLQNNALSLRQLSSIYNSSTCLMHISQENQIRMNCFDHTNYFIVNFQVKFYQQPSPSNILITPLFDQILDFSVNSTKVIQRKIRIYSEDTANL